MPFDRGSITFTIFELPEALPENVIDLFAAHKAGTLDSVSEEPQIAGSQDTTCSTQRSTQLLPRLEDAIILLCVRLSGRFRALCSTPSAAARSRLT